MGRGSARSIPGIDIGGIIRAAAEAGVIEYGGGHAMAAGFSLTFRAVGRLSHIRRGAVRRRRARIGGRNRPESGCGVFACGCQYRAGAGDRWGQGRSGAGNAEPLLALPGRCGGGAFADVVGGSHVKLRLAGGDGTVLDAIAFRAVGTPLGDGLLGARGRLSMWQGGSGRTTGTAGFAFSSKSRMRRLQASERPAKSPLAKPETAGYSPTPSGSALRLSVRTQDFHSCKRGSTPLGRTRHVEIIEEFPRFGKGKNLGHFSRDMDFGLDRLTEMIRQRISPFFAKLVLYASALDAVSWGIQRCREDNS